jgi:farnesyl-diphosphate farnesyltransferase
VLRKGRLSLSRMSVIDDLLQRTSRTFALAIPLLPEPTRNQVGIAYLLFRIADTFEDGTLWPRERRLAALDRFAELLAHDPADAVDAESLAAECLRDPPIAHDGYRELLARMPLVLRDLAALSSTARTAIARHVTRSVEGMQAFVRRADGRDHLSLVTIKDLRDYCYAVAGIVGEMLTELYIDGRVELRAPAEALRNRAAAFGEGLQLVNILKDAPRDAEEGRVYLPPGATATALELARRDLDAAGEYVALLRESGTDSRLVAFNAFISGLARSNLRILAERGLGAKLSRGEVAAVAATVAAELAPGARGEPARGDAD